MSLVKAKLIKRSTEDGDFEVFEFIPLGTPYMVDPTTRQMATTRNVERKSTPRRREVIKTENGRWFPTEMLEIDEVAN